MSSAPGAIGGSIAARLAANTGQDVSVLARGKQLDAIRRNGLTLIAGGQRVTTKLRAASDSAELGPQDMVVLALKPIRWLRSRPAWRPLLRRDSVILPVQNGVPWWYFHQEGGQLDGTRLSAIDPDGALWAALDPRQVIGAGDLCRGRGARARRDRPVLRRDHGVRRARRLALGAARRRDRSVHPGRLQDRGERRDPDGDLAQAVGQRDGSIRSACWR
ncbi:MAG: 2-dehydropantoate 2-reductase N-terminal domain-containing protein [Pseudomonadota bacterium]